MGIIDKVKNFGSKIVKGIRKSVDFVRDKVAPVIRKALPYASTAAKGLATALGHPEASAAIGGATQVVDKGLRLIGR